MKKARKQRAVEERRESTGAAHVALLRGVNVGGKNKVPMAVLVELFEKAGCEGVRTYIQSGNVVFCAPRGAAERVCAEVRKGLVKKLKVDSPVVVRSGVELARVVKGNPFPQAAGGTVHVMFLEGEPEKGRAAELDPRRSPGDSFVVRGREVDLHLPNGVARSKLTNAWFDSKLGTVSTGRNWRTVLTLAEMACGGSNAKRAP